MKIIDVHAHILGDDTIGLIQRAAPKINLKLSRIDDDFALIEWAGNSYKPYPRGAWDLERRFKDMATAEVDVHVLSVSPQMFLYGQEAALTAATSTIQNDQIAKLIKQHPDRFMGIATLPMQAPELAADELKRAMGLGLAGAQIGSNIAGKNLDDPSFEPLWAAAAERDAFILIHPVQVAGADRLKSYYLGNLIGNPLDTTIAAACLVFGGVLERYPKLKICLAHGGGLVPYQAGRWVHGWHVRPEPKVNLKGSPEASIKRLLFDTIVHSQSSLEFLVRSSGPSRVLLGSDYPFDMGTLECARQVRALTISEADRATVLGNEAARLIGAATKRVAHAR